MYILQIKPHLAQLDQVRSAHTDQILKRNEQIYALLAMTVALCPRVQVHLEESVLGVLREKYEDKMLRMGRGEEAIFGELFAFACPKFVSGAAPNAQQVQSHANPNNEVFNGQVRVFTEAVQGHKHIPALKQYLLLYTVRFSCAGWELRRVVWCAPGGEDGSGHALLIPRLTSPWAGARGPPAASCGGRAHQCPGLGP